MDEEYTAYWEWFDLPVLLASYLNSIQPFQENHLLLIYFRQILAVLVCAQVVSPKIISKIISL